MIKPQKLIPTTCFNWMNSQNPAKTSHHRVFSIVHEICRIVVSDQVALWVFRNLIPKVLIASISE